MDIPQKFINWTDKVQAVSAAIICLATVFAVGYGYWQYRNYQTEKRPYVSLIKVDINSNLISKYPISYGNKQIRPSKILNPNTDELKSAQKSAEEIIVGLHFKNTGPVGAVNVNILWGLIKSDRYLANGTINKTSRYNDETAFREIMDKEQNANILRRKGERHFNALVPEQEITNIFMFNPNELKPIKIASMGRRGVNCLYLLCKIDYKSMRGQEYEYFGVYTLSIIPAYTKLYTATLIRSDVK